MSFEDVVAVIGRMATTTEALAAVGVRLGSEDRDASSDPAIVAALDAVIVAAGIPRLNGLTPEQRAAVEFGVRLLFRETSDLLEYGTLSPGWRPADPLVLDGQGRASMVIPALLAKVVPEMGAGGAFLDVGVGAGWLSIAAARIWPECQVVGIDHWAPALERARSNVHDAGLDARISLRNQDVADLTDVDAYECVWLPTTFLAEKAVTMAVPKVFAALRRGGWIVLGRYEPPSDPLSQATTALRIVRHGGCQISSEDAARVLGCNGFASVRAATRTWLAPIGLVIGQKP